MQLFTSSSLLRAELGDPFVEYLSTVKGSEVKRFNAAVTDWEQREYFEVY
ncbi:hypothetical protein [Pseudonocardia dioxanivorans]|nr:hypothetical protein [Pseudonocardia dioxanivorans]